MPTKEILEQNPCCMQLQQHLVKLKGKPTTSKWVSLAKDCHANTEVETHIKIKDLGSFNIPISINGVFLGEVLCDLGAIIILMSIEIFKKIRGLRMVPSEKLVGVVDGTMYEPKRVLYNVKVEVDNFKLLADIVVMDMVECPVSLARPFLATAKA